jgi:hypothetical protein
MNRIQTMTALALPAILLCAVVLALPAHATDPDPAAKQAQKTLRADSSLHGTRQMTRRRDGSYVSRGRISGKGRIEADHVVIEHTLAPGDSPGCITFSGSVTFTASAIVEIELAGTSPCTAYDRVTVGGTLTITSATLDIVLLDGFVPQYGDRFDILDWGVIAGTFGTIDAGLSPLPSPLTWDVSQLHSSGEITVGVENFADGDIYPWDDPDGQLTLGDILIMQEILSGQRTPGALQYAHADLYPENAPDGQLTLSDLIKMQQALLQGPP